MEAKMRVLVGYDGSECADAALYDLRRAGLPAEVHVVILTSADLTPHLPRACYEPVDAATAAREPQVLRDARVLAQAALAEARSTVARGAERVRAEFPTWEVHTEVTPDYSAYRALVVKADQWRPDLLVVGSHGRSAAGRALLGSVSQQVLSHAICSVRVARFREDANRIAGDPVRLVVGIDGSVDSAAAVDAVRSRHWPRGSEARVVVAVDPRISMPVLYGPPYGPWMASGEMFLRLDVDHHSQARQVADAAASRLRDSALVASPVVQEGDPKQVLLREAEQFNADCIVLGAKGHSRMERFLLGGVSAAVAARATCSVEVVRGN